MNLAINVSTLTLPITGIGRYVFEIIKQLIKRDDISLFLYSHAPLNKDCLEAFKNCTIKEGDAKNDIERLIWMEKDLPRLMDQDKVDLFWEPAHKVPFLIKNNIPTVLTIHDLVCKICPQMMPFKRRVIENIYVPHSIKKAAHITTVSESTRNDLITYFNIPKEKVSVVHSATHIIKENTKKNDLPRNYILFVGTLEPRKNLCRLLEAYSRLEDNIKSDYPLLIAGGQGWGDVDLNKLIAQLNISKNVQLLGYVDDKTIESLYEHCSFLAFPSLYEGFGLPIIEAAKYGKMVLTSNTSSMPEIASDYGIYVDPISVDSIFKGLTHIIHSRTQKEPLTKFTWGKSANELVAVFEKVLGNIL